MALTTIKRETGPNPTASVIWMHGLGADGNDFVPIIRELDLENYSPIRFIFPNAPRIPVTVNGGFIMPAWYDIRSADIVNREDELGIRASQRAIEELIEIELAQGVQKIVLAGFSQGCAMALHVGLRYHTKLAGIIGLSGYLPLPQTISDESHKTNLNTPIFMAHGTLDPIVPFQRAEQSRDFLRQLGYDVQWYAYPMEHTVCIPEIEEIGAWLRRILK